MDSFIYQCKKQKTMVQNEVPFLELPCSSNNLKAMSSVNSPTRAQKTYMDSQTMFQALMNGPNELLLLQAVSFHEHTSIVSQWSCHVARFMNTLLLLQSCIIYPLLAPELITRLFFILGRCSRHLIITLIISLSLPK